VFPRRRRTLRALRLLRSATPSGARAARVLRRARYLDSRRLPHSRIEPFRRRSSL